MQARRAAVKIQAVSRGHAARKSLRRMQAAAVQLQAAWRASQQRARYKAALWEKRRLQAAIAVQAVWRGSRTRRELARLRAAAIRVQAAWRCHLCQRRWARQLLQLPFSQKLKLTKEWDLSDGSISNTAPDPSPFIIALLLPFAPFRFISRKRASLTRG